MADFQIVKPGGDLFIETYQDKEFCFEINPDWGEKATINLTEAEVHTLIIYLTNELKAQNF